MTGSEQGLAKIVYNRRQELVNPHFSLFAKDAGAGGY